jgi:DNA-binding NtrC family response regulator
MNPHQQDECPVIVLVEDDARQRKDIAQHLGEAGFAALEAGDSDSALALLQARSKVQALVTNAHLPGKIDGFELARVVRERWPKMTVIMMSGHSDASSGPIPEGGVFIAKPYLFEHLVPTLARSLGRTG